MSISAKPCPSWLASHCCTQTPDASSTGRKRSGRQVELCVAEEDVWAPLLEGQECVLQVVMSAKRLEEGLGLAPGKLPQSLVDGEELVLLLVSVVLRTHLMKVVHASDKTSCS